MVDLGKDEGVCVLPGVEVNTKEEIHCLAFFENADIADRFQEFLDSKLPFIPNNTDLYGHQFIVDKDAHIVREVEPLLVCALEADIYEVSDSVYRLGGIFIPAHIDRTYNSIISQLGFVPPGLKYDALEVSARYTIKEYARRHPEYNRQTLITNSDAHQPDSIGRATTMFEIEKCTFAEIIMALRKENNRKTVRV
jgi:PHP family Zn ribbon phosphoesterase